jgi:GNAT superfamily N-acetyltransferase
LSFQVRPATQQDVAQMHSMIIELAEFEKAVNEVIATEEQLSLALFGGTSALSTKANTPSGAPALYAHVIDNPNKPGELAGMAIWFLNYSTWQGEHGIYLEDLYVRPEFRGQGLGKSLLKTLAQICTDRGYTRFQWWVLNWNQSAIDVYKSIGAIPMDEWVVYRLTGDNLTEFSS